jgi:hypothetical protein
VSNSPSQRTIFVTLAGVLSESEMNGFLRAYRAATDSYRGEGHLVLADARGLRPLSPANAEKLGSALAYSVAHGAVRCAHVHDVAVVRLQAQRLAREVDPQDRVILVVTTTPEAEAALAEARHLLENGSPEPSGDRAA